MAGDSDPHVGLNETLGITQRIVMKNLSNDIRLTDELERQLMIEAIEDQFRFKPEVAIKNLWDKVTHLFSGAKTGPIEMPFSIPIALGASAACRRSSSKPAAAASWRVAAKHTRSRRAQ